jgi:hypothetical protein
VEEIKKIIIFFLQFMIDFSYKQKKNEENKKVWKAHKNPTFKMLFACQLSVFFVNYSLFNIFLFDILKKKNYVLVKISKRMYWWI